MQDIYDNGTPKYQYPADIYEALGVMESGEEIGILSELFADVSWENQDYYYTDNGSKLRERWNAATEYGDKMWLMEIAAWQLSKDDANEWVYEALCNEDLAKRLGFKKLFVDTVLGGAKSQYKDVSEAFEEELRELAKFNFYTNSMALEAALNANGYYVIQNPYSELCSALYRKLKGLRLEDEKQLLVESRALLTAYDDFMFGLKSNQYLYKQQETMYRMKVAQLQTKYEDGVQKLLAFAQMQGIALPEDLQFGVEGFFGENVRKIGEST